MAQVIHEHTTERSAEGGMGFFWGALLLIAAIALIFYFGIPYIRSVSAPQVVVPDQIDVNVNQPAK